MDLDVHTDMDNCTDHSGNLEIRDGEDSDAPLLGRYCGSRVPPSITTQEWKLLSCSHSQQLSQ